MEGLWKIRLAIRHSENILRLQSTIISYLLNYYRKILRLKVILKRKHLESEGQASFTIRGLDTKKIPL